jgi:hypothetical protein
MKMRNRELRLDKFRPRLHALRTQTLPRFLRESNRLAARFAIASR